MLAKKCPKCNAVWYTALPKCAFCGIEGVEVPTTTHTGRLPEKPQPAVQPEAEKKESTTAVAEATPIPPTSPEASAKPAEAASGEPPLAAEPAPAAAERKKPFWENEAPPPAAAPPPQPVVESPSVPKPPSKPSLEPLPVELQRPDPKTLAPAPQVPSARVPVVCGLLGLAAAALLPVATFVPLPQILAIVITMIGGALLPFAPFAWWIGQRYEDRCIALKFRPASAGRAGRVLGAAVTFILALEGAAAAFLAAVHLFNAGK